ncbi:hypothetical protein FB451DRAFT_1192938 [Mycena latifolia]|nr:hypothetical protein FB451DRAFT_1192938 [Mycena latifolia]
MSKGLCWTGGKKSEGRVPLAHQQQSTQRSRPTGACWTAWSLRIRHVADHDPRLMDPSGRCWYKAPPLGTLRRCNTSSSRAGCRPLRIPHPPDFSFDLDGAESMAPVTYALTDPPADRAGPLGGHRLITIMIVGITHAHCVQILTLDKPGTDPSRIRMVANEGVGGNLTKFHSGPITHPLDEGEGKGGEADADGLTEGGGGGGGRDGLEDWEEVERPVNRAVPAREGREERAGMGEAEP